MKVTLTKCDRCGEIEAPDSFIFTRITIKKTNIRPIKGVYGKPDLFKTEDKDLCPTCTELLASFMKGDPPPNLVPVPIPVS